MNQDAVAYAKVKLEELLAFFHINAEIDVNEGEDRVELDIQTADSGRLIGHHGETLRSLQYILNQIVARHTGERSFIAIDVAGYKKGRAETLTAKAKATAEEVISTGKEKVLGPLNAAERRVVHMAIGDIEELETESTGVDPHRKVIIRKRGNDQTEDTTGDDS